MANQLQRMTLMLWVVSSYKESCNNNLMYGYNIQVNEKVYKLERVYRDCIKNDKRQDKDNYTVYCMMHQALDDSDQTRKYGISDP